MKRCQTHAADHPFTGYCTIHPKKLAVIYDKVHRRLGIFADFKFDISLSYLLHLRLCKLGNFI
jgi:hypothetical protein